MSILLSAEEKAVAVAIELERTKDSPDDMLDYSDIIAKAQLKRVVEWGFECCTDHQSSYAIGMKRIDCPECRQVLLKEIE